MDIVERNGGALRQAPPLARWVRPAGGIGAPALYEKAGPFEILLASSPKDLKSAQRLRYRVFYEEGGALAGAEAAKLRRDLCPFDAICDHLIVVDTETEAASGAGKRKLVGTYRLLRREVAERHHGFYSQSEFDLAPLLARHPNARMLELGRSCVHPNYRSRRVIELLWRGLWLYAKHYRIDTLIGCASLPGADPEALKVPLSFLVQTAGAEDDWQVAAWPHCAAKFAPLARDEIDERKAFVALPPLMKAYLRTGARCSRDVVVDRQFGTTDVFTVLPMADIEERYLAYYGEPSCVSGAPVA